MIKHHGHMYYTIEDVASRLYVSKCTARRYCQEGKLKAKKYYIKRKNMNIWCIAPSALDNFMSERL